MKEDIVVRLRAVTNWFEADNNICPEAAGEIERLREALRLARADLTQAISHIDRELK